MIDYKEKYEQAIERLKQWDREHPNGYAISERDEFIFPELKESEDEKIRKALMQNLKERFGTKGNMGEGLDMPDVLAWFEKQGEQKFAWGYEDERNLDWLTTVCERIYYKSDPQVSSESALMLKEWLKSLRPQWKPSGEQIDALNFAANCVVPAEFCIIRKVLKGLLEQLKKLKGEQL